MSEEVYASGRVKIKFYPPFYVFRMCKMQDSENGAKGLNFSSNIAVCAL